MKLIVDLCVVPVRPGVNLQKPDHGAEAGQHESVAALIRPRGWLPRLPTQSAPSLQRYPD